MNFSFLFIRNFNQFRGSFIIELYLIHYTFPFIFIRYNFDKLSLLFNFFYFNGISFIFLNFNWILNYYSFRFWIWFLSSFWNLWNKIFSFQLWLYYFSFFMTFLFLILLNNLLFIWVSSYWLIPTVKLPFGILLWNGFCFRQCIQCRRLKETSKSTFRIRVRIKFSVSSI